MRAGKGGSDEYLADWRRESVTLEAQGDLQALAEQEASQLEARYSDATLLRLIANFGKADTP